MILHKTIRAVAAFEAFKGVLVLTAASGLLLLVHRDLHDILVRLAQHAHLNPAAKYPSIFINAATHLQNARLALLALGAATYTLLRFIEAYGLYHEASWAEVLAAASGMVYIPFELVGLVHRLSWLGLTLLILNILVVAIMVHALLQKRRLPPLENNKQVS